MTMRQNFGRIDGGSFIQQPRVQQTGLDFPGSAATASTIRFKFTDPHSTGLPIYGTSGAGVTYIWKCYPRAGQGSDYWTTFFWGNDDGTGVIATCFLWVGPGNSANTYYGPHPYPGSPLQWEISVEQQDFLNGNVVTDVWYDQAFIAFGASGVVKQHEYYWNLPATDSSNRVTRTTAASNWGDTNPPSPALTWGDAPWNPSAEMYNGVLRGIQIYNAKLTTTQVNILKACEFDSEVLATCTAQGITTPWYLCMNPTPTDITDKSGSGHNPAWVGSARPTLYKR